MHVSKMSGSTQLCNILYNCILRSLLLYDRVQKYPPERDFRLRRKETLFGKHNRLKKWYAVHLHRKRRRKQLKDKDLRKMIGSRIKQRRTELNLHQKYIAEKMDVNTSTIQRYEAGTIDNTKKLILEGLADALHVSVEWLKGETDEYETVISDKRDLQIRDLLGKLSVSDKEELSDEQFAFSKDLLIYILSEYELFLDSFKFGCTNYKNDKQNKDIAKAIGIDSVKEYNEIMFLREVTHSINAYNDIADVIRLYSKNPEKASERLADLMADLGSDEE